MRRLFLLVGVVVFMDTMLYAALTPLLPQFAHEFGLSKLQAGVLVGAYAAGALVGGLPGGFASARLGSRRAVLIGLILMSVASLGFAFAGGFWTLFLARFAQGLGSAFTWAGAFSWLLAMAPRDRRGEMLGSAMAAAIFGALFGPVVGVSAALVGRVPIFAVLAALAVVLVVVTLQLEPAAADPASTAALRRALRNRHFVGGLALMVLPSLLFGILGTLGPLHLAAAGWGAAAIGAVWLVSAALEAMESPFVGRLIDRRGRLLPIRVALVGGVIVSLGLASGPRPLIYVPLIVLGGMAYGILFTPAFALIADGAETARLAQGVGFGFMNAAWATGAVLGPIAGGAIASSAGDSVPFLLAAVLCAVALAAAAPAAVSVWRSRPDGNLRLAAGQKPD